jgi:hypothetical protein
VISLAPLLKYQKVWISLFIQPKPNPFGRKQLRGGPDLTEFIFCRYSEYNDMETLQEKLNVLKDKDPESKEQALESIGSKGESSLSKRRQL